jgi:hypothetical protein
MNMEWNRISYLHAGFIPIVSESDDNKTLFLSKDCLVHSPPWMQVRQQVRHLSCSLSLLYFLLQTTQCPLFLIRVSTFNNNNKIFWNLKELTAQLKVLSYCRVEIGSHAQLLCLCRGYKQTIETHLTWQCHITLLL